MFIPYLSKCDKFSLKISGEIICQSWLLLTPFFNLTIVQWWPLFVICCDRNLFMQMLGTPLFLPYIRYKTLCTKKHFACKSFEIVGHAISGLFVSQSNSESWIHCPQLAENRQILTQMLLLIRAKAASLCVLGFSHWLSLDRCVSKKFLEKVLILISRYSSVRECPNWCLAVLWYLQGTSPQFFSYAWFRHYSHVHCH